MWTSTIQKQLQIGTLTQKKVLEHYVLNITTHH